ncbi:cytoplasmic protein [Histomonas meleagridis]|uniref:cytoplasmic protein n=1 Tax=Histomonas meleagridis TaxID=135588 RepID=UPI00355A9B48|nr:cytoplasmic protein [Histomonas meleagridis]KAH0800975.1 cytoplasmic protein [Histomonas meleagridis]
MSSVPQEVVDAIKNLQAAHYKEIDQCMSSAIQAIQKHITSSNLTNIMKYLTVEARQGEKLYVRIIRAISANKELIPAFFEFCSNFDQHFGQDPPGIDYMYLAKGISVCELRKEYLQTLEGKTLNDYQIYFINEINCDDILPEFPGIFAQCSNKISHLESLIEKSRKNCYFPVVEERDSTNPRDSKFGGRAPYLPNDGPSCKKCGEQLDLIFSLYIKSLPEEIQQYFPEDERESVLVGNNCSDGDVPCAYLYRKDEIDNLLYTNEESNFNEHRVVVGWEKSSMVVTSDEEFQKVYPDLSKWDYLLVGSIIDDAEERGGGTYLGGYPVFVQSDEQPEGTVLLLEMDESEASTNIWGDCGTAQVWMKTGSDFGEFEVTWACG